MLLCNLTLLCGKIYGQGMEQQPFNKYIVHSDACWHTAKDIAWPITM